MAEPVVSLGWSALALLLALMAAVILLSVWLRLGVARAFAVGTVRALAQLSAVGFVIGWVFMQQTWYWVLTLLAVMSLIAGLTGARRTGVRLPGLTWLFTGVLVLVSAVTLLYLTQVVLSVREWNPRYLIPLGGMLLGNTMTAATLAIERLASDLRRDATDVEMWLALGASPQQAGESLRRAAVRAAVMPSINGMMILGVVTLPGMMTGQMLGGTPPMQAALYQLLITFGIAFCTLVGATLAVTALYPRFFTPAWQVDWATLREGAPPRD